MKQVKRYFYSEGENGADPVGETVGYDSVHIVNGKVAVRGRTVKKSRYKEKALSGDIEARNGGLDG